MNDDITISI